MQCSELPSAAFMNLTKACSGVRVVMGLEVVMDEV